MKKGKVLSSGIPTETIINKILLIRGKKVMIDRDLAELYGVTTKRLNEQVKRNLQRFPEDFMFQITQDEWELLVIQFEHLSVLKYSSVLPYVFTEHGAVMLASVLNSAKAIEMNILVVRAFTQLRQLLVDTTELRLDLEKIRKRVDNHSKNVELVFNYLDEFLKKKEKTVKHKQMGYRIQKSTKKVK